MENASKALLFAAEALIGVIILSIGVALFTMFQGYTQNTAEQLMESQISEFNSNFTKFYGNTGVDEHGNEIPIKVSAHDIISVANFAFKNNLNYELVTIGDDNKIKVDSEVTKNIKNTYYVKVGVYVKNGDKIKGENFYIENWSEEDKNNFLLEHSLNAEQKSKKEFKCIRCDINPETRRVYDVLFVEI